MLATSIIHQLKSTYGSITLSVVLCNGLSPREHCRAEKGMEEDQPRYFVGMSDSVIVFPPATDNLEATQSNTISYNIAQLMQSSEFDVDILKSKKWVLPIAEEQATRLSKSRKHWVTLHYDPATGTATLIDSRPSLSSLFNYSTTNMKASLERGLAQLGLEVNMFEVKYQSIQPDDIHCGAWTAYNVMALADGMDIQELAKGLNVPKTEVLIANNIALAEALKHEGTYLSNAIFVPEREDIDDCSFPSDCDDEEDKNISSIEEMKHDHTLSLLADTHHKASGTSLDSAGGDTTTTEGLSDECDDEWEVILDEVDETFNEATQQQWLVQAKSTFTEYMNDPTKQLDAIFARQNVRYNSQHLVEKRSEHTSIILTSDKQPVVLETMLEDLQSKYKGTSNASEVEDASGFAFSRHGHPYQNLVNLGVEPQVLDNMSIADAVIFDAVAFQLSSMEQPIILASNFMPDPDLPSDGSEEKLFDKAIIMRDSFLKRLQKSLKTLVTEHKASLPTILEESGSHTSSFMSSGAGEFSVQIDAEQCENSALTRKVAELEALLLTQEHSANERVQNLQAEYDKDLAALRVSHEQAISGVQTQEKLHFDSQLKSAEASFQSAYEQALRDELAKVKGEDQRIIDDVQSQYEKALPMMSTKIEEFDAKLLELNERWLNNVQSANTQIEALTEELEQARKAFVDDVKSNFAQAQATFDERLNQELTRLQNTHENRIVELEAGHVAMLADQQTYHGQAIEHVQAQHDIALNTAQDQVRISWARNQALDGELANTRQQNRAKIKELEVQLHTITEEGFNQEEANEYLAGQFVERIALLEKDVNRLENQIELQAGQKTPEDITAAYDHQAELYKQTGSKPQTEISALQLLPKEQESSSYFLEGLSLQIIGGFAEVIGISLVTLALAALITGAVTVTLPISGVVIGGGLLAITGFFAYEKGCQLKAEPYNMAYEASPEPLSL